MRIPGVIVYYSKDGRNPVPVPVFEYKLSKDKIYKMFRNMNAQEVAVPCFIFALTAVVTILDPIPGDEVLIPIVFSKIAVTLAK